MKGPSLQYGSAEHLEIRNTGLRPNWNDFWALSTGSTDEPSLPPHASLISSSGVSGGTTGTGAGIRHVRLITGSEWIGEWDRCTGMTGMGMYKMPHGVIYEGTMKAGLFEGVGVLKYPNGSSLEGLWYQGKLRYWQYDYADGLERDCHDWDYCSMPDRRFYSEYIDGFRPAMAEHVSNDYPARDIPPGHYDAGQGFYNPKTHCIVDVITGEVLSIPTAEEEKWIMERCRSAEPLEPVGFCPDLYENLFAKPSPRQDISPEVRSEGSGSGYDWGELFDLPSDQSIPERERLEQPPKVDRAQIESEKALEDAEKEILSLLRQEGAKIHPTSASDTYRSRRKLSLHDKLGGQGASEQDQEGLRVASFEGILGKILKGIDLQKHSVKTSDDSGTKTDRSSESNLFRLTHMISVFAETANVKKTASPSLASLGALEQFKILGKLLPSLSLTTAKQFPTSYPERSNEFGKEKSTSSRFMKMQKSEESMLNSTVYDSV